MAAEYISIYTGRQIDNAIGEIGKKLDKVTTGSTDRVYGVSAANAQIMLSTATTASPSTVAVRTADGRLKVAEPSEASDAANKGYVEDYVEHHSSGGTKMRQVIITYATGDEVHLACVLPETMPTISSYEDLFDLIGLLDTPFLNVLPGYFLSATLAVECPLISLDRDDSAGTAGNMTYSFWDITNQLAKQSVIMDNADIQEITIDGVQI